MSMELDKLDKLAASVFDGYLVRKDLVRKYSRQYPVPTYVVEFLLGRYCASVNESEITEGLQIVEKQLKDVGQLSYVQFQLLARLVQGAASLLPIRVDAPGTAVEFHQQQLQAVFVAGEKQRAEGAVVVAVVHGVQPPE